MYGLILEGGGAKGAYQIGACIALKELGIEIKGVAGTSIGALNGAMIVQGDFEKIYKLWYDINPAKVLNINEEQWEKLRKLEIKTENFSYFISAVKNILNNKGIDTSLIRQILQENIDEERLRNSNIDFGVVTVSLTDRKPFELFLEDIPKGKVVEYLMASAYFPGFKLEKMDGKYFVDGGVYDNMPIGMLASKGYKDLIVIRSFGIGRIRKVSEDGLNIIYINPRESLCHTLDFSQDLARKNLNLGYYDAFKTFHQLKGNKYYIRPKGNEFFYIDYLMDFGETNIRRVGKILGVEDGSYLRILFEVVVPRLAEYVEIERSENYYEEIVIGILEMVALEYGVERFRIYTFEEFVEAISAVFKPRTESPGVNIPEFIKKSELLSLVVKEEVYREIALELFNIDRNSSTEKEQMFDYI